MSSGTAHDRDWRRGVRRILPWVLAGVPVWLAVTQWLAPWLIRGAHEGRIPLLSGVIEGRDRFPVSRYLAIWDQAVLPLTLGFLAFTAVLLAVYGLRHRIRTAIDRVLRREPTVTWRGVLAFALVFGALTGLAEACIAIAPLILNGDPQDVPGPEALWMGPLAAAVAALVMSLPLVALARRKGVSLRLVGGAFALLFAYTVIVTLELGIHRYAAVVLGWGIAVTLASLMARRPAATRRSLRVLGLATPVLIVLGLASTTVGGRWLERSRLARLTGVPGEAPNVLMLILDTVRAASMSLYGYDRATTPAMAAFAGTGVTFDRAISPSPWTLPAHASIFTGRLSHEVGTDFRKRLDETHPTLAEILSERGYATAGFAANLAYTRTATGLARGFAVYRDGMIDVSSIAASSRWTRRPLETVRPWFGVHGRLVRKTAEEVNEEFTGWLDQRRDRPFFAFLNYFDAHGQYETHAPFDRRFSERSPRYWLLEGTHRPDSPELLNEIIDSYDSALAYLDHHVGQLLETLRTRGILDNTIVIITSDHGEMLGEHEIMFHANSLYLPLLHVPLVISFPPHVPSGRRVPQSVATYDLAATVLDLAGLDETEMLPGRTLRRYWETRAGAPGAGSADAILSEMSKHRFTHPLDPAQRGPMTSLIRGDMHYIRNGDGVEELYDIRADPAEENNLQAAGEMQAQLSHLRATATTIRRPRITAIEPIRR